MIGRVLAGRYRVESLLGTGGMGEVYRAQDLTLERPVAVKMLRAEFANDQEFIRRFRQEATAAASLSNPHIVGVFDVGEDEGEHYIVMELVDGRTLKDEIRQQGRLALPLVLTISQAVASALVAAHAKKVVHRDVKPENILLTARGEIKVADFGIAKAASSQTLIHTKSIVGSAHYISPEQARGGFIDEKSDLYSLGAIMYEMLTGRPPFDGPSPIAVALRHIHDDPAPVRKLRPDVPRPVEAIVMRLLAKAPEERPTSAQTLAALSQALQAAGGPVRLAALVAESDQLAPTIAVAKDPRRRRRIPWGWLIPAVVLVAIVAGGFMALAAWVNAPVVRVPNVVSKPLATAMAALQASHLTGQVSGRQLSQYAAGDVVSMLPAAGGQVKEGRVIELVVSSGRQQVSVPNLIQEPLHVAYSDLVAAGLKLGHITYVPSLDLSGTVVSQSPGPGSKLAEGTPVALQVSKGNANLVLTMPNVVGEPVQTAANQLGAIGLQMQVTAFAPSASPDGTVLDQSVTAGTKVTSGQTIDLTTSSGPPPSGGSGPPSTQNVTFTYSGSQAAEVRVLIVDAQGVETAYDQIITPGTSFSLSLNWQGSGRLEDYVGSSLVFSGPLPLSSGQQTITSGP